jgi:hypothetical protein
MRALRKRVKPCELSVREMVKQGRRALLMAGHDAIVIGASGHSAFQPK